MGSHAASESSFPAKNSLYRHGIPGDALGYEVADEAMALAQSGEWRAAEWRVQAFRLRVKDARRKRSLETLRSLLAGFAAWDVFDHRKAAAELESAYRSVRDLADYLPAGSWVISTRGILSYASLR